MDFPKSVPGVGLVDGKFVDENKATGQAGSLIPSQWGNAVSDEILNVIRFANLVPAEGNNTQLLQAIGIMLANQGAALNRYPTVPAVKGDDEIYVRGRGEMIWTETAYFVGYRSPHCGRPVDGHTNIPLSREVDAVGGLLSKTDYAGLWAYAQEQALVVTQAVWTANVGAHYFVDVSGTQFRIPDLRNMFRRFTGTDADTANARTLATKQAFTVQTHSHTFMGSVQAVGAGGYPVPYGGGASNVTNAAGSAETRPVNTGYAPRLYA